MKKGKALKKGMVLMKPVKKKGAGNPQPKLRKSFPEVDQDALDDALDSHIRQIGVQEALNLLDHRHLQPQQAEIPRAMFKLHPLLKALVQVSPSAEIRYRNLKHSLTVAVHKFGAELLNKYWEVEAALLPGRAADSILVLLKHWRRVTASPAGWERFGTKLDTAQFQVLTGLYKKTGKKVGGSPGKRKLKKEVSDVTMASDGFPAMLATSSASEAEDGSDGEASEASEASAAPSNSLLGSPPPVTKAMWREKAGKPVKKRPAGKGSKEKDGAKKKPAAGKKPAAEVKKKPGDTGLGPDTPIAQETLSIGGGKNQSYIQHMPFGPNTVKKLVVSVSLAQAAKLKVSHKQLVEELLPACKQAGATKASVLAARLKLFQKYEKA